MDSPPTGEAWLFWLYFGISIALFCVSVYYAWLHTSLPGFVLVPVLLFLIMFDNLAVAVTLSASSWDSISGLLAVRFALQSFAVPLRLLTSFELAYVVRKKRSSNFFCMTFDQGHRKKEGTCSSLVRYSVWLVAFVLIFVSTIANAEHILAPSAHSYTATTRFSSKTLDPTRFASGFGLSELVDVVPEAMSLAFLLFVGLSLWRYGTAQSMDVSATAINKWSALTGATLALLLAWVLQPLDWHCPYAYNGCALALAASLTLTGSLIDHNLKELNRLNASITTDNEAVKQQEPEVLPPRFRSNSRDLSRPRRHSALGSFRQGVSESGEEAVEVDGTHFGDVGILPKALRRPLPDGPRPPEQFVGVNPMRTLG